MGDALLGNRDTVTLDQRLYNALLLVGALITATGPFVNALAENNQTIRIIAAVCSVALFIMYYVSRARMMWRGSAAFMVFVLVFGLMPLLWFTRGGSVGGGQHYLVFLAVIIVAITRGVFRIIALLAFAAMIAGLLFVEYQYPGFIARFSTRADRLVDVGMGLAAGLAGTMIILNEYVRRYRLEHDQLRDYARRLELMAIADDLTGIANRRYVMKRLREEIDQASRYQRPLSLILFDVDHFKGVNQSRGHGAGDRVLVAVVRLVEEMIRSTDLFGRYGGEEFVIVLPETTREGGLALAEKIRKAVETTEFHEGVRITVSIGVAERVTETMPEQLIERAHASLFRAKRDGRNRVES